VGKEREKPPVQKFTRRDFLIFVGLGTVGSIVIPWTLQKLRREIEITKDIFLPIFLPMVGDLIHLKSCDIRVVKDLDPQYDIDTEELKRLFEDNGVFCPYWIFVTIKPEPFWVKKIIKDQPEFFSLGDGACLANVCSIRTSTSDREIGDTEGHDFSILNNLEEEEKPNWLSAYESWHVILYLKGLPQNELQCDRFANENYQKYRIVVK